MSTLPTPDSGALLRRHRRAAGLTQEALAERAGVSVNAISAMERGLTHAPHQDTIELLAEALLLSPAERVTLQTRVQGRPRMPDPLSRSGGVLAPIVGRALELTLLQRHLAGEGPPLLLLAGEPCIKSGIRLQLPKPQPTHACQT